MTLLQIAGESMRPILRPGDRIFIRRVKPQDIRFGDIISYTHRTTNGAKTRAHRVLARLETPRGMVFLAKGDREVRLDAPVPAYAVGGVVHSRERRGRCLDFDGSAGRALNLLFGWIGIGALAVGMAVREFQRIVRLVRVAVSAPDYWICRALAASGQVTNGENGAWRLSWDRFREFETACPKKAGTTTLLQGRVLSDTTLSGEIRLTGDVEIPEDVTVRIMPASSIGAHFGGPQLSIRRHHSDQILELCDPGRCHLVVRGRLIIAGEPKQRVAIDGDEHWGGIVLVGAARTRISHADFRGDSPRMVTAVDSTKTSIETSCFSGGSRAISMGHKARARLSQCQFHDQRESSIYAEGSSDLSIAAARFSGGRRSISMGHKARARLSQCQFHDQRESSIHAEGSSDLSIAAARFSGGRRSISMGHKALGRLKRCLFYNQQESSILAEDSSTVSIMDSYLSGGRCGVFIDHEARARLTRCLLTSHRETSLAARGRSHVRFRRCAIRRSPTGFHLHQAARGRLWDCRTLWCGTGAVIDSESLLLAFGWQCRGGALGFTLAQGARGILTASRFLNVEQAILAQDSSAVLHAWTRFLRCNIGIQNSELARSDGFLTRFNGSGVGFITRAGAPTPKAYATIQNADWLDRIDINAELGQSTSAFPKTRRQRLLGGIGRVGRIPIGRFILRMPYNVCFLLLPRLFKSDGLLWLRRSWASGEAVPGFSDVDIFLQLTKTQGTPAEDAEHLLHLARRWSRLRAIFPFLGEPILAKAEDTDFCARRAGPRSRAEIREWRPLYRPPTRAGSRKTTQPSTEVSLQRGMDRWATGLKGYIRLVATASDPAALTVESLWRHRGGRAWNTACTDGGHPLSEEKKPAAFIIPELPSNPKEACGAALQHINAGAGKLLAALREQNSAALTLWTLNPDECQSILNPESTKLGDIQMAIEDPGHVAYLLLAPEATIEERIRSFQAAAYVRALHPFMRCLGVPVTPDVLSLALMSPYRDWPYQTHLSRQWPKYRPSGAEKFNAPVLWRWSSEEGGERGELEIAMLAECLANLRLHWRGRALRLSDHTDPCSYLLDRLPAMKPCFEQGPLPAPWRPPNGACPCRADFTNFASRIADAIGEAELSLENALVRRHARRKTHETANDNSQPQNDPRPRIPGPAISQEQTL